MDIPTDAITDTTPVPLSQAIKLFFPMGGVSKSSLRREARKGRLVIERIANKDFVTRRAIEEMRRRCRVANEAPPPKEKAARERSDQANQQSVQYAAEIARRLRKGEPMPGQKAKESAEITVFPRKTRP